MHEMCLCACHFDVWSSAADVKPVAVDTKPAAEARPVIDAKPVAVESKQVSTGH